MFHKQASGKSEAVGDMYICPLAARGDLENSSVGFSWFFLCGIHNESFHFFFGDVRPYLMVRVCGRLFPS